MADLALSFTGEAANSSGWKANHIANRHRHNDTFLKVIETIP